VTASGGGGGTLAGGAGGARRVLRLLRAEGARALADRARDRLLEERRRRSFLPVAAPPAGFSSPILNLAAAAPAPRLGGVQAQLLWRLEEETKLRPVALLYPEPPAAGGGGFRLELQRGRERQALSFPGDPGDPGEPGPRRRLPASTLLDAELERAVAWAADCCAASALHVEGLAAMPLASLLNLRRQAGLRLVLSLHDFAAFCPRPHLLESLPPPAAAGFCHYSRNRERCARCLGRDEPGLAPDYQEDRRELARQLLAAADAVVFPSPFLAGAYHELFAGAGGAVARVIAPAAHPSLGAPPARPAVPTALAEPRRRPRRGRAPRLHVAWVGAVHPHKGALVFEAAVRRLAAAGHRPRLTAYGGGDRRLLARWRRLPGLRVRGYYRAGSLPALLRRDRVDLALLLSVVPESYGLALDECAAAAVPVVAFDLGALAGRIAAGSGLLLGADLAGDPAAAGAALATLLADLVAGRLDLPPAPPPPASDRHPAATARAWMRCYRDLALLPPER